MPRACTFLCGLVGIDLYAGTTGTVEDIKAPLRVDIFPSGQKVRTLIRAGNGLTCQMGKTGFSDFIRDLVVGHP